GWRERWDLEDRVADLGRKARVDIGVVGEPEHRRYADADAVDPDLAADAARNLPPKGRVLEAASELDRREEVPGFNAGEIDEERGSTAQPFQSRERVGMVRMIGDQLCHARLGLLHRSRGREVGISKYVDRGVGEVQG